MSSEKSKSRKGSVLTTIGVGIACLIAADVFLWSRSDVEVLGANPVSFAAGKTAERAFIVDDPGKPHVIQIEPYTKPKEAVVLQDTRYVFKFAATIKDPAGKTVHEFADKTANHRTRGTTFTPAVAGEHVIAFETTEGDQRATLLMHAGEGSAIIRTIKAVAGN